MKEKFAIIQSTIEAVDQALEDKKANCKRRAAKTADHSGFRRYKSTRITSGAVEKPQPNGWPGLSRMCAGVPRGAWLFRPNAQRESNDENAPNSSPSITNAILNLHSTNSATNISAIIAHDGVVLPRCLSKRARFHRPWYQQFLKNALNYVPGLTALIFRAKHLNSKALWHFPGLKFGEGEPS